MANNTASRLQDDLEEWKQEMAELQRLMSTAPGDALVCAAAACYSVLAPTERFDKSVEKWCKLCRDAGVTVREVCCMHVRHNIFVSCVYTKDSVE